MECFSVDRFMHVDSEKELELVARSLSDKKLFYSGIYFNNPNISESKEISYTIRVDIDNTPVTIENRKHFWYPGPEASFTEDMRYHRGFIEMQHAVDIGIIKYRKHIKNEIAQSLKLQQSLFDELNDTNTDSIVPTSKNSPLDIVFQNTDFNSNSTTDVPFGEDVEDFLNFNDESTEFNESSTLNSSTEAIESFGSNIDDYLNFADEITPPIINTTTEIIINTGNVSDRSKRSPEFSLLSLFGDDSSNEDEQKTDVFEVDQMNIYTKEFPYPKYKLDDFKKGMYFAQAVQMTFFLALILQVSSMVRHRIWMRESGNRKV